jgi:uncharacterized protein (TIGR02145 family)
MKKFGFWNRFIENQIDKEFGAKDIDNNHYGLKRFNNQTWMLNNLNVSRFRNGDPIMEARTDTEWINAYNNRVPAWCYYNNDPEYRLFGKLYNIHAVMDYRGLAPEKFHIPNDNEWDMLVNYVGDQSTAGEKLGMSSDFNAYLTGIRGKKGVFEFMNMVSIFWTSTHSTREKAWIRVFYFSNKFIGRNDNSEYLGAYIRCVKD